MKIRTIKIIDPQDKNPRVNNIGPDPELEPFAMLPPGVIPDMTLVHYENVHFNLIVSRNSRLFLGTIENSIGQNYGVEEENNASKKQRVSLPTSEMNKEIQNLEEELRNLKKDHENCLN